MVWKLYVLCGACICNFKVLYLKFWKVRVWSFVVISNIHNVFIVMGFIKNSNKGWWDMFDSPLEDFIYILGTKYCDLCLCASSQELILPPYIVRVVGFSWIFGIWEFGLFCQTLSIEVHERKIGMIWPFRLIDLLLQTLS